MKRAKFLPAFLTAIILALLPGAAFASDNLGSDGGAPKTIVEVSPMSITLDAGNAVQISYAITGATSATLSGTPIRPEDLRAGMTAVITVANDGKTATAIHANPAPRTTKKPPKDNTTTVWIVH